MHTVKRQIAIFSINVDIVSGCSGRSIFHSKYSILGRHNGISIIMNKTPYTNLKTSGLLSALKKHMNGKINNVNVYV